MGGRVGLTVRFSAEDCYRGSCHTSHQPTNRMIIARMNAQEVS